MAAPPFYQRNDSQAGGGFHFDGSTFTPFGPPLDSASVGSGSFISALAAVRGSSKQLYAIRSLSGVMSVSADGGETWVQRALPPGTATCAYMQLEFRQLSGPLVIDFLGATDVLRPTLSTVPDYYYLQNVTISESQFFGPWPVNPTWFTVMFVAHAVAGIGNDVSANVVIRLGNTLPLESDSTATGYSETISFPINGSYPTWGLPHYAAIEIGPSIQSLWAPAVDEVYMVVSHQPYAPLAVDGIWRTLDGGANWIQIVAADGVFNVNMTVGATKLFYAVRNADLTWDIRRCDKDGTNVESVASSPSWYVAYFLFRAVTDDFVLATVFDQGAIFSISSGSFTDVTPPGMGYPYDAVPLTENTWLAVGSPTDTNDTLVFQTTDAGATWTLTTDIPEVDSFVQNAGYNTYLALTVPHPGVPNSVVMLGNAAYNVQQSFWSSADAGLTWSQVFNDADLFVNGEWQIHAPGSFATICPALAFAPLRPVLDFADTLTRLYVVMIDSSAWMFSGGVRTQLAADMDGRQMALGMVAVATAGEAAFFCDWKGQLWATGTVYVMNDVTGEWTLQQIDGYVVQVPIKASSVTLLGPHGIGPSYMNSAALWVNSDRNLIGLGQQDNAELENGLLPSSPPQISQPMGGGYNWPAPDDGSAVPVFPTPFDYRQYIWRALATSNYGAYAYFGAKVGGPIRPQGHMIG